MRKRWILAAVATLAAMAWVPACATGTDSHLGTGGHATTGSGGAAASTTTGSSMGGSATGGGGTDTGGGATLCGNGTLDPGEDCDGSDFGGATCESLGLGAGQLQCNPYCTIVAAACTPNEDCGNGQDDDFNGLTDCEDPACSAAPACLDSCPSATTASVGDFLFGDTTGRPNVYQPSCTTTSGKETFYLITPAADGTISLVLSTFGPDLSLSVRTACDDVASEIACTNKFGPNDTHAESLSFQVTAGKTYYVMVDGVTDTATDTGSFELEIDAVPPETDCANLADDDVNGYADCDDSACQATAACMPGAVVTGQPCAGQTECAANHHDPICLQDAQGFPGGYCSEFCDVAAQDCAGDAVCYPGFNFSKNGVCLDGCIQDGDCRVGYACADRGLATKVCVRGPEAICNDYVDNDKNGKLDCEDPGCQSAPECASGSKGVGQPCTDNTECFAPANNPICLDQAHELYPGGYCSHFCDLAAAAPCGAAAICVPEGPSGQGVCWQSCNSDADCRVADAYHCVDFNFSKKVCTF